jgi:hypothetical protein
MPYGRYIAAGAMRAELGYAVPPTTAASVGSSRAEGNAATSTTATHHYDPNRTVSSTLLADQSRDMTITHHGAASGRDLQDALGALSPIPPMAGSGSVGITMGHVGGVNSNVGAAVRATSSRHTTTAAPTSTDVLRQMIDTRRLSFTARAAMNGW